MANDTQSTTLYLRRLFELDKLVHDKCWCLNRKGFVCVCVCVRGEGLVGDCSATGASYLMGVGSMSHPCFANCRVHKGEEGEKMELTRTLQVLQRSFEHGTTFFSTQSRWRSRSEYLLKGNVNPCLLICSSTSEPQSVSSTMNGGEQILSSNEVE